MKRIHMHTVIILALILLLGALGVMYASGFLISFGQRGIVDTCLNSDGSRLYVSYYLDGKVIEIDTSTSQQIRSFNIAEPTKMTIEPDNSYLYVVSLWPGGINRIRLSDGDIDSLALQGEAYNLCLDQTESRLWVIHRTWPVRGDIADPANPGSHPNTGFLTEIDASAFSVTSSVNTWQLPMTIWHSPIVDNVYIYHEGIYREYDENQDQINWNTVQTWGNEVSIFSTRDPIPVYTDFIVAGMYDNFDDLPIEVCKWSDDGRFWAIPSMEDSKPEFSIRVLDTFDNSAAHDLLIPAEGGGALNIGSVDRAPGSSYLWATIKKTRTPLGMDPEGRYIARISTSNLSWEIFPIDEAISYFGSFSAALDDNTIYLTQPDTGQILVWSPPNANNPPICSITANLVTYTGSQPVSIEFSASGSYDPDQGDVLTYSWDFNGDFIFGDPFDSGTDIQPVKIYSATYNGPVSVRVTDNHNASSTCTITIFVEIT